MRYWELLEDHLDFLQSNGTSRFTSRQAAADMDIWPTEASTLIQSYLSAQIGTKSETKYVLHRTGRTSAAIWHMGHRAADAHAVGIQFVDDMQHRVIAEIEPVLTKIGVVNPRAVPRARAVLHSIEAGVEMIGALLDGDD